MLLRELRFLWLATGGTSPWPVGARAGAGAAAGAGAGVSACPCADPAMCRSLSPQPNYTAHRMAFHVNTNGGIAGDSASGREWQTYDLTKATSIALFTPLEPALLCAAHQHGVRILDWTNFIAGGDNNPHNPYNDPSVLLSPAKIATWINNSVNALVANGYDGAMLDIEVGFTDAPHRDGLKAAICGLKARLEEAIPGSLVAFATAYYIQGNPYDYAGIAGCGVLLVPMTYCDVWVYNSTATKIPSQLYAGACNPLPSLRNELTAYLAAGIPACQIAPILPWFGNRVDCLHPVGEPYTGGNGCMLGPKGGTGSGAGYGHIMEILAGGTDAAAGPRGYTPGCAGGKAAPPRLDRTQGASVFDIYGTSPPCHQQVWYDSPQSLPLKYNWLDADFGGFGIWDAEMVAAIKGYVGPTWNASSKINGPSACGNNVSTPACAEDWNQTKANGVAMWGAVPDRR